MVAAVRLTPTPRVRVKFPDRGNLVSWRLRVLSPNTQNNKDFSGCPTSASEQVECLLDEKFRNGLVLGSSYQSVDVPPAGMTLDKRHTTFMDGAVLEYDRALHVRGPIAQDGGLFKYDAAAHAFTCTLPSGASFPLVTTLNGVTFSIDAAGNENIKPTAGDINIKTSAFETSINAFFALFNNHVHSGVESGDSDTANPTTQVPS